jgi:hypothetical protein
MNKTSNNGSDRNAVTSQEPEVEKEETTFESALREEEIDEVFVAKKLRDLSRAQGRRWNPKKGSWEKFEDYGTQLAALREIAKILGIYLGADESENDNKPPVVIDLTGMPYAYRRVVTTTNGQQDNSR